MFCSKCGVRLQIQIIGGSGGGAKNTYMLNGGSGMFCCIKFNVKMVVVTALKIWREAVAVVIIFRGELMISNRTAKLCLAGEITSNSILLEQAVVAVDLTEQLRTEDRLAAEMAAVVMDFGCYTARWRHSGRWSL